MAKFHPSKGDSLSVAQIGTPDEVKALVYFQRWVSLLVGIHDYWRDTPY